MTPAMSAMETGLAMVKLGFEDGPVEIRSKKIDICFVSVYYFRVISEKIIIS